MHNLRLILSFVFLALMFAIFAYFISNTVIMQGVDALEAKQVALGLDRVIERLEQMEAQLAWQTRSLACSDFNHEALQNQQLDILKERFSKEYLASLRFAGLAFFLPNAKPFLILDNEHNYVELTDLNDPKIKAYTKVCNSLLKSDSDVVADLLEVQGEVYILTAQRVFDKNFAKPFAGCLIVIKSLNREFSAVGAANSGARFSILPAQSYFAAQASSGNILVDDDEYDYKIILNHNEILAYALAKDFFGNPACCIESRSERFLIHFGDEISLKNFIFMIIVGLVLLIITMIIMHDIEHEFMIREIEHRTSYDGMTNLLNKTSFMNRLNYIIKLNQRIKKGFAVIFVNLERFRWVNDSYGYAIGDELLYEVGQRFCKLFSKDNVGRLGGDKFCIIAETDKSKLVQTANSLQEILCSNFKIKGQEIFLTCNMGIAYFPDDSANDRKLIQRAELAMYHAENSGKSSIKFFTKEMEEQVAKRLALEMALTKALDENALMVFYQPKIDVNIQDVVSCEALIRWPRDNHWISPAEFIPVAEETGLVTRLDMFVLRQACKHSQQWLSRGLGDVRVAVNMSARSILSDGFVERVDQILYEEHIDPALVEVEITESTLLTDLDKASQTIGSLHKKGINISLDDFGTGYSSLRYLSALPITCLKIDKSFIDGLIDPTSSASELVRGTLALAEGLGKSTVAEGVEKTQQLRLLRQWGCHVIQGYIFSKPLNNADFTDYLEHKVANIAKVMEA